MPRVTLPHPFTPLARKWPEVLLLGFMLLLFIGSALGVVQFGRSLIPDFRFSTFTNNAGDYALPSIATSLEFALLLVSGGLLVLLLPLLSPISASALVLCLSVPAVWLAMSFPNRNSPIPMQFHLLVLLILFGVNVLLRYFSETQERRVLLDTFSHYLPPEIVSELSKQSHRIELAGESRYLTVMFCDLRNFTAMSELLKPQEVVTLLNHYFTTMTTVLFKYGATIDKYVGDCVMAFWGAPLPQHDHAKRALLAAAEMHQALASIAEQFNHYGLPSPEVGIGINTGLVSAGNMGSNHRVAYTVIGDAVNLAARMQSVTREYEVHTIVGETTVQAYPDMLFRELDQVTLRGKRQLSRIYEPLCLQVDAMPALTEELALQKQALSYYYNGDLEQALRLFRELQTRYPKTPYYAVMLEKLRNSLST